MHHLTSNILIWFVFGHLSYFAQSTTYSNQSRTFERQLKTMEFSFQVQVRVRFSNSSWTTCSGSLIEPQWVVTYGRCVVEGEPFVFTVLNDTRPRETLSNETLDAKSVSYILHHPENDFALLKLEKPQFPVAVDFSRSNASDRETCPGDSSLLTKWLAQTPNLLKRKMVLNKKSHCSDGKNSTRNKRVLMESTFLSFEHQISLLLDWISQVTDQKCLGAQ